MERNHHRRHGERGEGISIVVPFRGDTAGRQEIWDWMRRYYESQLPAAQIVEGHDTDEMPFSKTSALNDGCSRANGDVWVLLDADAYLNTDTILLAARKIREHRRHGVRTWYVPYRHLCRLTKRASHALLESDPAEPFRRPGHCDCQDDHGGYGENEVARHYMAMAAIVPREAFECIEFFDPRFRGWGSEDVAILMAWDTIFGRHRTLPGTIITPWHATIGRLYHRMWLGAEGEDPNGRLGSRYRRAWGDIVRMRALLAEYQDAA